MKPLPDEIVFPHTGRAKVATFDTTELGVRLFEACFELKRPADASLAECVARIKRGPDNDGNEQVWESCLRMAERALSYVVERMEAATDAETTH